jgi:hypothetical protein
MCLGYILFLRPFTALRFAVTAAISAALIGSVAVHDRTVIG